MVKVNRLLRPISSRIDAIEETERVSRRLAQSPHFLRNLQLAHGGSHGSGGTDPATGMISDTAYDATTWNGVTDEAASKNALRDQIEVMVDKADFDAQSILAATSDNAPVALVVAEQEVVGRITGGNVDGIALGIADNNIVQIDGSPNDDEFARFTANGLEGRTAAEALVDIGAANPALSNLASVAINTSLISDTNNTDDLGSDAKAWKDIHYDGALTKGGTEGKIFVPLATPASILRHYTSPVSDTRRLATVSSVSGTVITLTANEAYRFWCAPGESSSPDGNAYRIIKNHTQTEYAWISTSAAVNTLTVTDATDISGWVLNDVLSTQADIVSDNRYCLDVSPIVPAGAIAIITKMTCRDTAPTGAEGLYLSQKGVSGTFVNALAQVANASITFYPFCPIWTVTAADVSAYAFLDAADEGKRLLTGRDLASGVDTLSVFAVVVGYFI